MVEALQVHLPLCLPGYCHACQNVQQPRLFYFVSAQIQFKWLNTIQQFVPNN